MDQLAEIRVPPRILSNCEAALSPRLRESADTYMAARSPSALLDVIVQELELQLPPTEGADASAGAAGTGGAAAPTGGAASVSYNVRAINALVMRVGVSAIAQAGRDPGAAGPTADCAQMDIFAVLARRLQPQGRYMLLNACANQLRFPNSHTNYFSQVILHLFCECADDALVLEQITRVLLERLVVNRPHPWGLMITFIELVQNPRYDFWSYEFTVADPEVRRLVESVARSCVGPTGIIAGLPSGSARGPE